MFSKLFSNLKLLSWALVATTLVSTSVIAEEEENTAGQILFVHGTVELVRDNIPAAATRGARLIPQDVVATRAASSAQIRFVDNSLVAIRPNSTFLIESYNFDELNPDASEQRTQLVRGSLRAVTGAIGRARPEQVEFQTPVATMGIRGTVLAIVHVPPGQSADFNNLPPGTYMQVEDGFVLLTNNTGSILVGAGETFYVEDEDTPPVPAPEDALDYMNQQNEEEEEEDEEGSDNGVVATSEDEDDDDSSDNGQPAVTSDDDEDDLADDGDSGALPPPPPPALPPEDDNEPVAPPPQAGEDRGEDEGEELIKEEDEEEPVDPDPDPEPEPAELPAPGVGLTGSGYLERIRDLSTFQTNIVGQANVLTRAETDEMTFIATDSIPTLYGSFNVNNFNPNSSNVIDWGMWSGGQYVIIDADGEERDNTSPFPYMFSDQTIGTATEFQAIAEANHSADGTMTFRLGGGTGVHFSHGEYIELSDSSRVFVDLSTGQITIELGYRYSAEDMAVLRTLLGSGSIEEFYKGFIELQHSASSELILEVARLFGSFTGNEDAGIDALLAGLFMAINDGGETYAGYGLFYFLYCWMGDSCELPDGSTPSELPPAGIALTGSGYLERDRNLDSFQTNFIGGSSVLTRAENEAMTFIANAAVPELYGTFALNSYNPFSSNVIDWGLWAPGQYTLVDDQGAERLSNHYFPYMFSDMSIASIERFYDITDLRHADRRFMHFRFGGGTGVHMSNSEVVQLDDGSRIIVDLDTGGIELELAFRYSAEDMAVLRTLFGSGTIEEFYDNFIELEETTAGDRIVELARLFGTFTGNENDGIDALLTGLFLALQDGADVHTGYGLFYFLYCWMGETCALPSPEQPEVELMAERGITSYGYTLGSTFTGWTGITGLSNGSYAVDAYRFTREGDITVARDSDAQSFDFSSFNLGAIHLPSRWNMMQWGSWDGGSYSFFDGDDVDLTTPLDSPEPPFHWAFATSGFGTSSFAENVLGQYEGTMSFRYVGGSKLFFGNEESIQWLPTSRIEIDLDDNSLMVLLNFSYSGDESALIRELIGSGSVADLYDLFIELSETGNDPIIELARLVGAFTGINNGTNDSIGGSFIDGLIAGIFMLLNDGDDSYMAYGTLAFVHCYLDPNCSFSDLPLLPGANLSTGGMLDRNFAQLSDEGSVIVTEFNGYEAPTYVYTGMFNFSAYSEMEPLFTAGLDLGEYFSGSDIQIYWGVWGPESYSIRNYFDEELDNTRYMPYLTATSLFDWISAGNVLRNNYEQELIFQLGGGPGMFMNNGASFFLLPQSFIILDPLAESTSEEVIINLSYDYEGYLGGLFGVDSLLALLRGYIDLTATEPESILDFARFYGSLVGNEEGDIETFFQAILGGLFVSLWDDEELAQGYGLYYFIRCSLDGNCDFETPDFGLDVEEMLLSELWDADTLLVMGRNNALNWGPIFTYGQDDTVFYFFSEDFPDFGFPQLAAHSDSMYTVTYNGEPFDLLNGLGSYMIDHGQGGSAINWGYWEAGSYTMTYYPGSGAPIEELDNSSDYHFLMVERVTTQAEFDTLGQTHSSLSYSLDADGYGIFNSTSETFLGFDDGFLTVNFDDNNFDLLINFLDGSSLFANGADLMELFYNYTIDLEGTGALGGGALTGVFAGPNADAMAAIIEGWLMENEELLRGIGIFIRD
ncbi:MAG: FecR domain-containing protein [Idiomarina sp.]|nr:FecR domain-containing protein [Idiomarina sp.]